MALTSKKWLIPDPLPKEVNDLLDDYPQFLRQVLYNRGITTLEAADDFLSAKPPLVNDPFLLTGMAQAVDRLQAATQNKEKVAIYGDYDADGVTATALLVQFFTNLYLDVQGYIPNRFEEGYGLNKEALASLKEQGVRVVVSVDCGIRSQEEAEYARQLGIDLIITDHHHPGDTVPEAFSVINPKQPGDLYPEKNLSGVGVAYKLASAFIAQSEQQGDSFPVERKAEEFLDLVAIGTISDLVPLLGENRWLVRQGIEKIRHTRRQGIHSLIAAAGLKTQSITAMDVSFMLGPRLNAAGRLDTALTAFQLLTTQNVSEASDLAQKLEVQNRERQEKTRQIQGQVEAILAASSHQPLVLFAADPEFNAGVVGLVASRLTETRYRPAIVAFQGPDFTRGSCRSIPEFHITEALDSCADLLEHHGGHAAAAGFTVRNERVPELVARLESLAQEQLSGLELRPIARADLEIPLSYLRPDFMHYLDLLQPSGQANPAVVFVSRDLTVLQSRLVGKDGSHLKLKVTDGRITYDAIAFRLGEWHERLNTRSPRVDLLYTFETNEFNGVKSLQLNVKDIQASSAA